MSELAEIPRRNVQVYTGQGVVVAGFYQQASGGVTISMFIGWVNQVCKFDDSDVWALYPCGKSGNKAIDGPALDPGSGDDIQPGNYVLLSSITRRTIEVFESILVSRARIHTVNHTHTARDTGFVERIRNRDGRCCITGERILHDDYDGFEAAHIFPISHTDEWIELDFKRFIQDDQIGAGCELNSIQQGFLCNAHHHRRFDAYKLGVNPDDNYRIFDFASRDNGFSPHGRIFYRNPDVDERYLPSPDLLRDHFRQCVLRNVRGAAESKEPSERRFDPDIDLRNGGFNLAAGSWWSGSEGKRQLEAELAGRLYGVVNV